MTLQWLIWSNEHAGFWTPNRHGYTRSLVDAGRFSDEEAKAIVERASLGGKLKYKAEDGRELPPEMMLLAPAKRLPVATVDELASSVVLEFTGGRTFPGNERLESIVASVIRFDRENRS